MCLALPGLLETVDNHDPLTRSGRVRFGGITRSVHLALVPDAQPGDHVLVHVGVALAVVDPAEVERLHSLLDDLETIDPAQSLPEVELGTNPESHSWPSSTKGASLS